MPPLPSPLPRPRRALLALCVALAASGAVAAPGDDPLADWLRAQGLVAPAAAVDRAAEIVVAAMGYLGVQYRRGGNGFEQGFDCSGFTRHVVAATLGLQLPRRADEQARSAAVQAIPREALQPGDLVFFNTLRRTFSHVGIYIGEGRFIHAPRTGAQVRVEQMGLPYWQRRFDGARRLQADAAPAAHGTGSAGSEPTAQP
jgi:cell wall-associated NlpC family hydrolase